MTSIIPSFGLWLQVVAGAVLVLGAFSILSLVLHSNVHFLVWALPLLVSSPDQISFPCPVMLGLRTLSLALAFSRLKL